MRKNRRTALAALAIAALMTLPAALGLMNQVDWAASDAWYQEPQSFDEGIVLVGIDQRAIEEIGPYDQWGREIIAMAIEYLNESEDCRPAAIWTCCTPARGRPRRPTPGWRRRRGPTATW